MHAKHKPSLKEVARDIRGRLVSLSHEAGSAHLGSCLSCVDILTTVYWNALQIEPQKPDAPNRDRFILSKGHGAMALYATLSARGFFSEEILNTYMKSGGDLPEHPIRGCVPGVEVTSGSLGHGLSLGLGMALASKIQNHSYRVFVLMSDGECNEGSVWEAAMLAPAKKVDSLVAIVDYNKWQATGRSEEVMALAPLDEKFRAFGWSVRVVDGHDHAALTAALEAPPDAGRPVAVIAHTIKGKGVSFMEDDNNWHYRIPTSEEVEMAHRELGLI